MRQQISLWYIRMAQLHFGGSLRSQSSGQISSYITAYWWTWRIVSSWIARRIVHFVRVAKDKENYLGWIGLPQAVSWILMVNHTMGDYIETASGPPVPSKPRRLVLDCFIAACKQVEKMVQLGTIIVDHLGSSASYSTQGQWDWRPCGEYRALNAR